MANEAVEVHEASFITPLIFRNHLDVRRFKRDELVFRDATATMDARWLVIKIPEGRLGAGFQRTVRVPVHNLACVVLKSDLSEKAQLEEAKLKALR